MRGVVVKHLRLHTPSWTWKILEKGDLENMRYNMKGVVV